MTRFGVVGGREALVRFCVLDDDEDYEEDETLDSTMITSSSSDSGCSDTTSAIFLLRRRLLGVSMVDINVRRLMVFRVSCLFPPSSTFVGSSLFLHGRYSYLARNSGGKISIPANSEKRVRTNRGFSLGMGYFVTG